MSENRVRVLLIDDDEFAHRVVSLDLSEIEGAHFEVDSRYDSETGLAALIKNEHDVCLLDYQLGETSGLDLLREAVKQGVKIPVIMLTAQSGHGLDTEVMRAGAADYLVKGEFDPRLLERCLRYAIERRKTMEALKESEERFSLAVKGANDGLWDWKFSTGEIYLSPRWKEMLGFAEEDLENRIDAWYQRIHPQDLERFKTDLQNHLDGKTEHFENEHRILHRDGTYRWVATRGIAVRDDQGRVTRLAGSQRDVTQSRGHDPLTGLPNRSLYLDRLARVIERARRRGVYSYAVLFIDLDRFKIVNDSLGHVVGDELLLGISRRLVNCVRTADTVARLGGDEFVLLLEDVGDPTDVTRVVNRIHDSLMKPFHLSNRDVFTSASIGIAMGSAAYEKPEDLLRDSDSAMYRAKNGGRARHELFDVQMHARAVAMLQLESELRKAIEGNQLRAYYQPIVSLETGKITGVEALVRWFHPTRGLVPPDEFIPLAEETGLIIPIDRWVLKTACAQVKEWQGRFPGLQQFFVAVNISKKQLAQGDFISEVERTLSATAIHPSTVSLELTESVVMENTEVVTAMLSQLRGRELNLAMDDFGTGYSSLSYLHKLPFSTLKVDRSFVKQMSVDTTSEEVVRAILQLARAFRLKVTAEGVETQEQLQQLRKMGCDNAQGYFISRPLEAQAIEKVLEQSPRF